MLVDHDAGDEHHEPPPGQYTTIACQQAQVGETRQYVWDRGRWVTVAQPVTTTQHERLIVRPQNPNLHSCPRKPQDRSEFV